MPPLPALKELTVQRPASHNQKPLYLSQQSALEVICSSKASIMF